MQLKTEAKLDTAGPHHADMNKTFSFIGKGSEKESIRSKHNLYCHNILSILNRVISEDSGEH